MSTSVSGIEENPLQQLVHAAGTDIGMRREENQDSFGVLETENCNFYIVADGMGGVKGGAVASNLSVQVFAEEQEGKVVSCDSIVASIQQANEAVHEKGNADPELFKMGTTFVGLAFVGTSMFILNVGDSRAYRIRFNRIKQLTRDHTLVEELMLSGAITAEQAENHPVSHMLTKSLGPEPTVEPDCWLAENGPARGDKYLLCSDGLYNMVSDEEILKIVLESSIEEAQEKCIELANERGGTDNITVIIVEVGDAYPVVADEEDEEEEEEASSDDTLELQIDPTEAGYSDGQGPAAGGFGTNGHADSAGGEGQSPVIEAGVNIESIDIPNQESEDFEEELEEPASSLADNGTSSERRKSRLRTMLLVAALATLGVVMIVPYTQKSQPLPEPIAPIAPVGRTEPSQPLEISRAPQAVPEVSAPITSRAVGEIGESTQPLPQQEILVEKQTEENLEGTYVEALSLMNESARRAGLSDRDVQDIVKRQASLRERITDLEVKIKSIGEPLSGTVGEILQTSARTREELQAQREEIRSQMDVATRRLAVWYGRRKRLETTNPINLAGEVSVSAEDVKEAKTDFERITWEYLKQAEELRYDPANQQMREKVAELTRKRRSMMEGLTTKVRAAIDRQIGSADQSITDLTLSRDRIEGQLAELEREMSYAEVLMSGTPEEKELKKKELMRELEVSQAELEGLEQLIPDQGIQPEAPAP